MKAFLLAAGLGTRLRPLTDTKPKCLVEVCGKPMLRWWIELFKKHGIDDILINTHHLPDEISKYIIKSNDKIYWDMTYEEILLGSAGTLRYNKKFVRGEKDFIVAYVDVLTNIDLTKMIKYHRKKKSIFTMAIAEVTDPRGKGIVAVKDDIVVSFEEKPNEPTGNLANMGIYVCSQDIFDFIPLEGYSDMADIIPELVGKMFAYSNINTYFCDMGSHGNLKLANETWRK